MPYAKLQQLGIVFNDLPDNLRKEVGRVPRKPALYGSGQRRKLWQTRHQWSLSVSFSMDTSPPANDALSTSAALTNVPSISRASPSKAITDTTTAHGSGLSLSLCTANSTPTTSLSSVPISDTTTTMNSGSVPGVVQPSEMHSSTLSFGDSPSNAFSTLGPPTQGTTRVQVRPPNSTRPCGASHRQPPSQTGFIIPQGKIPCLQHYKYMCSNFVIHFLYLFHRHRVWNDASWHKQQNPCGLCLDFENSNARSISCSGKCGGRSSTGPEPSIASNVSWRI